MSYFVVCFSIKPKFNWVLMINGIGILFGVGLALLSASPTGDSCYLAHSENVCSFLIIDFCFSLAIALLVYTGVSVS